MLEMVLEAELPMQLGEPQPGDNLEARPISAWGNPDSKIFVSTYLVWTTFMGKRIPWHKWALVPLKAVEADIIKSGVKYNFYDVQVYNNRNIAGTNIKSNHAWALAMDINPRENPYTHGALKTDIPLSVRTAFKAHGFKWGGDYRSVKDAMHFEYLGEPVKSEPAAPGLPEVAFGSRLLKLASPMLRGTDVLRLQEELYDCLIDVGRDGIFGTNTRNAVVAFQKRMWAKSSKMWDGIAGSQTLAKLKTAERAETFIDRTFLQPHKSVITGEMVMALREWYGITPLWTLSILGAETSMADPQLGGALVGFNNFGCMKAGDPTTAWGKLANGTTVINGMTWWTFPDVWTGMVAWGRLIKLEYLDLLKAGGVSAAAPKYYGINVTGYTEYVANLKHIEAAVNAKLTLYKAGAA